MTAPHTTLKSARDLHCRGLAVIPVPYGQKGPSISGWQNLSLAEDDLPEYFNSEPVNIGVLLGEKSGWIVDVDLDHPIAVELADARLPHTEMIWGRDGKPRSHRLYRVSRPMKTKKWTSKQEGMIVELRSTGCQTIAPGSTHPNGEPVRWDEDGEPAEIDPDELQGALDDLAKEVQSRLRENVACSPGPSPEPSQTGTSKYGQKALQSEADSVAAAQDGTRNDALNRAAFNIGTLIGGGEIDRGEAERVLLSAALECGLSESEARRTIESGISSGVEKPRQSLIRVLAKRTPSNGANVSQSIVLPQTFTQFPMFALPHSLRAFADATAHGMDTDPILVVAPALSVLAGAVGNSARVQVLPGWFEPSCLWTGVILRPGGMKTQTQQRATAPLHETQRRADADHEQALAEYEELLATWKEKKKSRPKDDGPTEPKPAEPVRRQSIVMDTTSEELAHILQDNPRGVGAIYDELGAFFGGLGRYAKSVKGSESDAAFYKSAFNGVPFIRNRRGESGRRHYLRIESPLVSVTGTLQPGAFERLITRQYIEDGLASRFLWALPPDRPGGWVDNLQDDRGPSAAYAEVCERLLAIPLNMNPTGKLRPFTVGLSIAARPVAKGWVNDLQDRTADESDEAIRAGLSKLKGVVFRIALLFHLIEWAENGSADEFGVISDGTLGRAIVVADWFANESRRVYSLLTVSAADRESRNLLEWIGRQRGAVTVRQLTKGLRAFTNDPDKARAALDALGKEGYGKWERVAPGSKGGRPTERFVLAGSVPVTETPCDMSNKGGFGDGDTGDTSESDDWGEV